jgi:hypothetical protein
MPTRGSRVVPLLAAVAALVPFATATAGRATPAAAPAAATSRPEPARRRSSGGSTCPAGSAS